MTFKYRDIILPFTVLRRIDVLFEETKEKVLETNQFFEEQNIKEKGGTVIYEADSDLRDRENIPLNEDIQEYFEREVLQYVPDAWIDHSKTKIGYSISFTRYFYNYVPPRSLEEIAKDIENLQNDTKGLLEEFLND